MRDAIFIFSDGTIMSLSSTTTNGRPNRTTFLGENVRKHK